MPHSPGDGGNNKIDYSNLNAPITIRPRGVIDKGYAVSFGYTQGTDKVLNVNKIVGAVGQTNKIDASSAVYNTASLKINLAKNSMTVEDLPDGVPNQVFEVDNFIDVVGTNNNDTIIGNNANNTIRGNGGNDILIGSGGNDTITGGNAGVKMNGTDSNARGVGEVDTLTGGGGANTFILGDEKGVFYLGNGRNDYAMITNYDLTKDRIQLSTSKGKIRSRLASDDTIDLFVKQQGRGEDLIAKIQLARPLFSTIAFGAATGSSSAKMPMASASGFGSQLSVGDISASVGDSASSQLTLFENTII